jgi:hypothetical protein
MKTILTLLLILNVPLIFSQLKNDSICKTQVNKKYSHTFYIGQPINIESTGDSFEVSAHYTMGFLVKKKNREVQFGYKLNTFNQKGGLLDFSFTSNSQMFYLLYGGRYYFPNEIDNFKLYYNWHFGVSVINLEDGSETLFGTGHTLPLPIMTIGIYSEIANRFEVGFTVEGILPVAYLRLGYKIY